MSNLNAKLQKEGGFTLVEMLIVVAIIAILIAISIPMVNRSLESAREATDAANERAALGLAMVEVLSDNTLGGEPITTVEISAWYVINSSKGTLVAASANHAAADGGAYGKGTAIGPNTTPHTGETIKVTYKPNDGTFDIAWDN